MTTLLETIMNPRPWIPLILSFALLGCVMPTPYAPNTGGGGYTEIQIDRNHYRVKFDGNSQTAKDRVWNFWLYRCAELTKAKGFSYFSLETDKSKKQAKLTNPYQGNGFHRTGYSHRRERRPQRPRLVRVGGPHYIYIPGYSYTITTWHTNSVVEMYGPEDLPADTLVMDAQSILDTLSPYISSDGQTPTVSREDLFKQAARRLSPSMKIVKLFNGKGQPLPSFLEPNRKRPTR